jgi:hypothetical protein
MQIDVNEEQDENAQTSIRRRLEFWANEISLRDEQPPKQRDPIISTDPGMQIDWNELQP